MRSNQEMHVPSRSLGGVRLFFSQERPESIPWTERLIAKLCTKPYREAFVAEGVRNWIARQIRALREQRGWSQEDLGKACDKPQSAISRIEDPDYGQLNLQTLFDVAAAFDVALVVRFVDYRTYLRENADLSSQSMAVESFSDRIFTVATYPPNATIIQWSPFEQSDAIRLKMPQVGSQDRTRQFPPLPVQQLAHGKYNA